MLEFKNLESMELKRFQNLCSFLTKVGHHFSKKALNINKLIQNIFPISLINQKFYFFQEENYASKRTHCNFFLCIFFHLFMYLLIFILPNWCSITTSISMASLSVPPKPFHWVDHPKLLANHNHTNWNFTMLLFKIILFSMSYDIWNFHNVIALHKSYHLDFFPHCSSVKKIWSEHFSSYYK